MKKIIILIILGMGVFFQGCKEVSESELFYIDGIKAEQNMDYGKAIGFFAKSLQYNREDAITWYAKGRCHLLLAMQKAIIDSADSQREIKIIGNLSAAEDCFRHSKQWGFTTSADVDSMYVRLKRNLH